MISPALFRLRTSPLLALLALTAYPLGGCGEDASRNHSPCEGACPGNDGCTDGSCAPAGSGGTGADGNGLGTGGSPSGGTSAGTGGAGATNGSGGTDPGSSETVSCNGTPVQRNTRPFGCSLAWGANGNEGNRSSYLDFITTWVGYEYTQDRPDDCDGCSLASALASTSARAVYYAYFAGFALPDCNLSGPPNLCSDGAQWLRDNRAKYLELYANYAKKTYQASPNKGVVWLLEGDFVQYTYEEQSNPFTMQELGDLARDVVCAIKANAPNALVAMNHSTWISNEASQAFWSAMPTDVLDFVWTTGVGDNDGFMESGGHPGIYNAQTARYDYLSNYTSLGLFVDTSFGASQMNDSWSGLPASTLNARISEGVIAVNVTEPPADYQTRLSGLRPQLTSTCE